MLSAVGGDQFAVACFEKDLCGQWSHPFGEWVLKNNKIAGISCLFERESWGFWGFREFLQGGAEYLIEFSHAMSWNPRSKKREQHPFLPCLCVSCMCFCSRGLLYSSPRCSFHACVFLTILRLHIFGLCFLSINLQVQPGLVLLFQVTFLLGLLDRTYVIVSSWLRLGFSLILWFFSGENSRTLQLRKCFYRIIHWWKFLPKITFEIKFFY